MPAADDFALCGGRFHAPGVRLHHRFQQLPRVVALQRQQAFIDRRKGHLGTGSRLAAAAHGDRGLHGFAHAVLGLGRADFDVQPVRSQANLELRHADLEAGFGQVHHGTGRAPFLAFIAEGLPPRTRLLPAPGEEAPPRRFTQPAAQHEGADDDVGRPAECDAGFGDRGNRHLDDRLAPAQRHHPRVDHAFTFHRHERSGLRKGHAQLQPRGLAGFDFALLGQQVNAVVVVLRKPELIGARHPRRGHGHAAAAGVVLGAHLQFDLAHGVELGAAGHAALGVGAAGAERAQRLALTPVVVAVEAADDALARGEGLVQLASDFQRAALERLAVGAEHDGRELHLTPRRRPIGHAQAGHHRGGPQPQALADRLHFAVRVVESQLSLNVSRAGEGGQALHHQTRGAGLVGAGGEFVGD